MWSRLVRMGHVPVLPLPSPASDVLPPCRKRQWEAGLAEWLTPGAQKCGRANWLASSVRVLCVARLYRGPRPVWPACSLELHALGERGPSGRPQGLLLVRVDGVAYGNDGRSCRPWTADETPNAHLYNVFAFWGSFWLHAVSAVYEAYAQNDVEVFGFP